MIDGAGRVPEAGQRPGEVEQRRSTPMTIPREDARAPIQRPMCIIDRHEGERRRGRGTQRGWRSVPDYLSDANAILLAAFPWKSRVMRHVYTCTRRREQCVCARVVHDSAAPQTGRLMSRDDNAPSWDPFRLSSMCLCVRARARVSAFLHRECNRRRCGGRGEIRIFVTHKIDQSQRSRAITRDFTAEPVKRERVV